MAAKCRGAQDADALAGDAISGKKGGEYMDPMVALGILAFVIGFAGMLILKKGKRKKDS